MDMFMCQKAEGLTNIMDRNVQVRKIQYREKYNISYTTNCICSVVV